MTWHPDSATLDAYAGGGLHDSSAYSAEAHLLACPACRHDLSARVARDRLDRIWGEVRAGFEAPRPSHAERWLVRVGVRPHIARLLAATPSLHFPWLVAVSLTLAIAALGPRWSGGGDTLFLVVAPLLPVAGVALTFGRAADPTWEIGCATPTGGFRLTLIRSVAVVLASLVLAGIAAVAFTGRQWSGAAWLIPSLALVVLTLAVSTAATTPASAVAVGAGWCLAVALTRAVASDARAMFSAPGQVALATVGVAAAAVMIVRRDAFERRTGGVWG